VTFVPQHDSCFDSSSDVEMPLQDIQFVQGCAEYGARYVRSCRMSDYSLPKQVYVCASACDEVTEAAIEA
jgi:hypothetical protein